MDRFNLPKRDSRERGRDSRPQPRGQGSDDNAQRNRGLIWAGIALVTFLVIQSFIGTGGQTIEFSRFLELVERGRVTEVNISETGVTGTYGSGDQETDFRTTLPPNFETNQLVRTLRDNDVAVTASQPSALTSFFFAWVLPILFIGGIYYFLTRRLRSQLGGGAGGPLSLGRNKAKLYDRTDLKTTFDDVAGVDEVEAELIELVDYLKEPNKFKKIGARIPKGVLLVGPPGTGKTLLARAVAGEAAVPFFYISASEFIELFVGLGAARVRDLFQQARQRAPAIVFIDEIDSVGQARSGIAGGQIGSHQEQEQTLQQLLTEMDGFEPNSGVIIIAASNRPEVLDQALLRPGRFDRQIVVNLPDIRGREEILRIHSREVKLADDADLRVLARRTPGFSGAQLANVINEGTLLAARRNRDQVTMHDLEETIDRVVASLERRSQVLTDEERYLMSEPELRDRIAVLLGSRSTEEIVFGFATTGAQDDLRKTTEIARRMVMEFGMSEVVGPINISSDGSRFLSPMFRRGEDVSEETETAIDREVKAILLEGQKKAREILGERRSDLDGLAEILLEKESIGRQELDDFFGRAAPTAQYPAAGSGP